MTTRVSPALDRSELLARLREHRVLQGVPERELEWIIEHGRLRALAPGDAVLPPDNKVDELWILLSGHVSFYLDRGAGERRTHEWKEGDAAGLLPYSRLQYSPGRAEVEEPSELLLVHRNDFPEMLRECPNVTAKLVQEMLDRARTFTKQDLHDDKMLSLGRLSAGLAHELDNPASAVMRNAKLLASLVDEADRAALALGAAKLSPEELDAIAALRDGCMSTRAQQVRSPLEQARHEEEIDDWLGDRSLRVANVELLADTPITIEMLESLEQSVDHEDLEPALRWITAACGLRTIVTEVGEAATRMSELVKAVRAFTHRDEAAVRRPVEIQQGLTETLAVLRSKAKAKSVSVRVSADPGLPQVEAVGSELNQLWSNLLDNALDAVPQGGSVEVTAKLEGRAVVVRVIDDGPGIPEENRQRIFEPFFTTKPVGQGTGQGLDIVRRLVTRQRGRVELFSTPGRTEFRVTLPVARDDETKDSPASPAGGSDSSVVAEA